MSDEIPKNDPICQLNGIVETQRLSNENEARMMRLSLTNSDSMQSITHCFI